MSARKISRGFTLVELMVGVAVTSIIMIAIASAVIGVSGAYNNEAQIRGAVEGGRTALAFIERNLRMAGYGIEPQYAFDFTSPSATITKDNYAVNAATMTDDLAFRYRDPYWLRRTSISMSDTSTLMLDGTFGTDLPRNTAILISCPGGAQHSWFRTTTGVVASDNTVGLTPYTGNNSPPSTSLSCLTGGAVTSEGRAYVFLLREMRIRLFVSATNGRAFLGMITDLSVDPGGANVPVEPLAVDVEEFQVAYVMNRPFPTSAFAAKAAPDTGGDWIMANTTGETGLPTSTNPPLLDDAYDSDKRYGDDVSNIRSVRINLGMRSTRKENRGRLAYPRTPTENSTTPTATVGDGYFRSWITSTVRTPNMLSRSFFLPPLKSSTTNDGNNDGA